MSLTQTLEDLRSYDLAELTILLQAVEEERKRREEDYVKQKNEMLVAN